MGRKMAVAGTGFEGREKVIRSSCKLGRSIDLIREPGNEYDSNAIAVYVIAPVLFGILGTKKKKIGYIASDAAEKMALKIDNGTEYSCTISNMYAPEGRAVPKVTIEVDEIKKD